MSRAIPSLTLPYSLVESVAGNWLAVAFWHGKVIGTGAGITPADALRDAHATIAISLDAPVESLLLIDAIKFRNHQSARH